MLTVHDYQVNRQTLADEVKPCGPKSDLKGKDLLLDLDSPFVLIRLQTKEHVDPQLL